MKSPVAESVAHMAEWLLLHEMEGDRSSEAYLHAVLRVCEKLRGPLTTLTGSAGYRALVSRALALARPEDSWLNAMQIKPDASLELADGVVKGLNPETTRNGSVELVAQILGLLETFIGGGLTLRLVHEVWADAPGKDALSETEAKA